MLFTRRSIPFPADSLPVFFQNTIQQDNSGSETKKSPDISSAEFMHFFLPSSSLLQKVPDSLKHSRNLFLKLYQSIL